MAPQCFWLPCRADQIYSPTLLFFLYILCERYIRIVYFSCFLRLNMRKTSSLSTSKRTTFIEVKITLRNIVLLGKCGLYYSICFTGGRRKRCRPCRILSSRSHQSVLGTMKKPEVVLVESAHRRLVFIIYRLTMCKCHLLEWCLSTISPRNHQIYP